MDVFYYVVSGAISEKTKNSAHTDPNKYNIDRKLMMSRLKQSQTTIAEKMRFLVKNNILIKDKWKFEPNWKEVTKMFQESIREYLTFHAQFNKSLKKKAKEAMRMIPQIFNEERVRSIIINYSEDFVCEYVKKRSFSDLAELYLQLIGSVNDEKFKSFKHDIKKLRKLVSGMRIFTMEEYLLERVEGELK